MKKLRKMARGSLQRKIGMWVIYRIGGGFGSKFLSLEKRRVVFFIGKSTSEVGGKKQKKRKY